MDGISGASAVIALAGFVGTTIQQLNRLIKDVAKAPKELLGLVRYLEDLEDSLNGTADFVQQLHSGSERTDFLDRITNTVEYCADIIKSIEALINKIKGTCSPQNRLQKKWTSLKFVLKKDEIDGMQTRLDRAINRLNFAVSVNSLHQTKKTQDLFTDFTQSLVTTHKFLLLTDSSQSNLGPVTEKKLSLILDSTQPESNLRPLSSAKPSLLVNSSSSASQNRGSGSLSLDAKRPSQMVSKATVMTWYNGVLGSVTIRQKSKSVSNALKVRVANARSTSEETVIILRPSFLKNHYELHIVESFGHISRTLNVDRVVDYKDPVFEMCRAGDIAGLNNVFCGGKASPYTVNPMGTGLLHCAAANYQFETCKWLLGNGVNADRMNDWGLKALSWMGTDPSRYENQVSTRTVLEIARLLVHNQEDLSAVDVSHYFQCYRGPPEGAELILSEYPVQYDRRSLDDCYGKGYPTLAAILRAYAREPSPWESILRALIRRGADLHARVRRHRREMNEIGYPCRMASYGTPLDELFSWNKGPFAARIAADGWLSILASEGHCPSNYLREEFILRAEDMHFTHAPYSPAGYDIPRKLFFELGDRPSVFWDWWIDPTSSTSLLREEFKCLVTTSPDFLRVTWGWEECWPFTYPDWLELHQGYTKGELYVRCQKLLENAEKRGAKQFRRNEANKARGRGRNGPRKIPGAWPK